MPKSYDRAYFDRWYRDPTRRVISPAALARKVAMVVAVAEFQLARPIRNVLDVGCGEAPWRAPLRALRPAMTYRGLDASPYVVARYGRSRQIGLARFGDLAHLRLETRFDLIVCSDVLHYLQPAEIRAGLPGIAAMLDGLAFLEVFTRDDEVIGDKHGFVARAPAWYLREFAAVGLQPCGSHGYLGARLAAQTVALERASPARLDLRRGGLTPAVS